MRFLWNMLDGVPEAGDRHRLSGINVVIPFLDEPELMCLAAGFLNNLAAIYYILIEQQTQAQIIFDFPFHLPL